MSQKKLQIVDDTSQWSIIEAHRELTLLRNEFADILKQIPSESKISIQSLIASIEQHLVQAKILLLTTNVSTALTQIRQANQEFEELRRCLHRSLPGSN